VNYRVRRKVSGSDWITVGTSTSTSYTDTSAKSGTTYIYTVCCVSPDDRITTSANSGSKSIKYIAAPKLSGVSNTTSGVKVSWGKVSGAEKYIVSRKTGSGSWAELDSTTSTSYTDTSAKSGTTYAYRVKAVASDDTSTSAYSGSKSIKYIAAPKLSGVSNTTSGVKVIWGKVTGAANYLIYRKTGSGKWTELDSTTSTSYTDKTAKAGTTYAYCMKVVASDGTSTSAYSGSKSIKYIAAPKLSSVSNAAKGVTIKWSASKGAVKYRVYRKNGSGSWGIIGETTSTSYTDTTAKAGTTYTYTVRCITADGKSTTSGYDSTGKTIKRLTQPTPTVSKTSSGIKTSWSKVSGANKYYVYRKTASGGWSKIATTTSTSYTDKTAKKGTTYYYTVKAASGSYSSSYTSSKAVKR
jgi:fibronectin type 3 domain-containing protein